MNNRIVIGNEYEYTDDIIRIGSINGVNTSSLVGDMLEIDQLKFRVSWRDKSDIYEVYMTPPGSVYRDSNQKVYRLKAKTMPNLLLVPYATIVMYYQNNALRAKMYFDHADQVSKTDFVVTCVSAIGVLDKQTHYGGIYTGQTVSTVISDIIGGAVPYSVSAAFGSAQVYGWLPIESKRDALHQLLFAFGANILKNGNGDIYFDYLTQTSAKQIPSSRVFYGGKAVYTPPSNQVEVTEHTYFQSQYDETVTLFDNTSPGSTPAGNTFIAFAEAPCYGLSASSGLTINSYGVNWAIISGVGVLTGKRYAHQTGLAVRTNPNAGSMEKVVRSSKCTLVSMLTSANVSRRLLSYYGSAQRFDIDIERTNEVVGDQVQFENPYGGTVTGFLGALDWNVTTFEKAKAEIIMDYEPTPPGGGGGFSHVAIITANGNWSVPANVTDIHVVLIGGGQGGQGGRSGSAGTAGTSVTSQAGQTKNGANGVGGAGGAAGTGGHGGKVFEALYEVTPGTTLAAVIGAGGAGGSVGGNDGSEGGNTTLSGGGISASSANGYVPSEGYYDVMNRVLYAGTGGNGTAGAAGGSGGNVSDNSGNMGGNVGNRTGGQAGSVVSSSAATSGYLKPSENNYELTVVQTEYSSSQDIPRMSGYELPSNEQLPTYTAVDPTTGNWSVQSGHYTYQSNYRPYKPTFSPLFNVSGNTLTIVWYEQKYTSSTGYRWYQYTKIYQSYYGAITPDWTAKQFAGGGGGASATANGSNASNNNAGAGASASAPSAPTVRGTGGNGGHGGGGGGGGGGATITAKAGYTTAITKAGGTAGAAGAGSAGSAGAAGCILIYY